MKFTELPQIVKNVIIEIDRRLGAGKISENYTDGFLSDDMTIFFKSCAVRYIEGPIPERYVSGEITSVVHSYQKDDFSISEWENFLKLFELYEPYMTELMFLKDKLELIRKIAKNLKHGEDCFKSHGYKDEMECRCSLPELHKVLKTDV